VCAIVPVSTIRVNAAKALLAAKGNSLLEKSKTLAFVIWHGEPRLTDPLHGL
jgi:hypothetical protein